MNLDLTRAYSEIDKELYDYVLDITIAQLIERKAVYDILLNRDVPSIFDPYSQKHEFTKRELEVIQSSEYDSTKKKYKSFLIQFFKANYNIQINEQSFKKHLIKNDKI